MGIGFKLLQYGSMYQGTDHRVVSSYIWLVLASYHMQALHMLYVDLAKLDRLLVWCCTDLCRFVQG